MALKGLSLAGVVAVSALGCTTPQSTTARDSARGATAVESFFADRLGRVTRATRPTEDTICTPEVLPEKFIVVNSYHVVDSEVLGDSAAYSIEVRAVAAEEEIAQRDHGLRVTVGALVDTLHWIVVGIRSGNARVCGYSLEGYDLGLLLSPVPGEIEWYPAGATLDSLTRLLTAPRPEKNVTSGR